MSNFKALKMPNIQLCDSLRNEDKENSVCSHIKEA